MQTLLITLTGPQRSIDLQVPGEIAISELLPTLLEICGSQSVSTGNGNAPAWVLKLMNASTPLPINYSLIDAGIQDGAILVLENMTSITRQAGQERRGKITFTPQSFQPGPNTGGIGVTWSSDGMSAES